MIEILKISEDVTIYGKGSLGGKGGGLIKLDQCDIPQTRKLTTHILTTDLFDTYRKRGCDFGDQEQNMLGTILKAMGDVPIGVRSSATNEACATAEKLGPVHAGENTSFMLPNNHPDERIRFNHLVQAVCHIFDDFIQEQPEDSIEKMAVVVNPIPGIYDDTQAGPFYYPYISGVANSFFPYALKTQNPDEGFARIAFGHGYATVLDEFPVISMATIKNPIPLRFLRMGKGQQFFYALDMTKNTELSGEELETMKTLHVRFANYHKIKRLGIKNNLITIEELIQSNHYGFKTGLNTVMETIAQKISSHFQIEFVFNIDFEKKDREEGAFHVVQLTELPKLEFEAIEIPSEFRQVYLSIRSLQGHGVKEGIRHAVVVSPFLYKKSKHDEIKEKIAQINSSMTDKNEAYIVIAPGRLGSPNRDWGIQVDYRDVAGAVAIFEYGVDICARMEPLPEEEDLSGGIYGSHFLYMIQGGHDEDQKRLQTRMYGTQGTHFLTNLVSNNVIYGYIAPTEDWIDPFFFSRPDSSKALYVLTFPETVTVYADSITQRCVVAV
ncbi:MAG: hypothetical protein JXB23_01585 [Candidatus Aminicenantes bacterium]|nr:hypothetical protein [Candidatus Aminicenantes bacterium]